MPRNLWGALKESKETALSEKDNMKMVPLQAKRRKLEEIEEKLAVTLKKSPEHKVSLNVNNPLVTQTIEVMKQTEMLHSLIDTYSNKSGSSNYLLNPCQIIPEVDFPPENAVDFTRDVKYMKPIWYTPKVPSNFSKGVPIAYPQINLDICKAAIRKAICGQLRIAGFTDAANSAIVLFTDAVEEFVRNFMEKIHETHRCMNVRLEAQRDINIMQLEKAYYSMTNNSILQIHNYFKHNLITRNRTEINEFKGALSEYDKLMKESQRLQNNKYHESEFMNIFDIASASSSSSANYNTMSVGENNGLIPDVLNISGCSINSYGQLSNIFSNDVPSNS